MKIYRKYAYHERTLADLSAELRITSKTLQKQFDKLTVITGECIAAQKNVVITMDVTRIEGIGGLFLARSNKQNLHWSYTKNECVADYIKTIEALLFIGHELTGFVTDGKPGVIKRLQELYPQIPCQYCQFHQIKTIKSYIPRRAQSEAARSLRSLALCLTKYHYVQFETALQIWRVLYDTFFTEKKFCDDLKRARNWRYTHQRLRSSYHSLKRNLPYLYTFQKHPTISMPNTTNACDGFFSHLKERLSRHRGLSNSRKKKMADYLLENW